MRLPPFESGRGQPVPHPRRGLLLITLAVLAGIVVLLFVRVGSRQFGAFAGGVGGVVSGMLFVFVAQGVRRGRQMRARAAATVLTTDTRPPVLYLRPFSTDGLLISGQHFLQLSFEQHLARAMKTVGPFVAIGSPVEDPRHPELGAARMYLAEESWQEDVASEIRQAGLVILHAGISDGLLWELQQVLAINAPQRLIVCLPFDSPWTRPKMRTADERYAPFRAATIGLFPGPLPTTCDGCAFLYFLDDWAPQLLYYRGRVTAQSPTQIRALHCSQREFRDPLTVPKWSP